MNEPKDTCFSINPFADIAEALATATREVESQKAAIAHKDAALKLVIRAMERCQLDCNHLEHWDKKNSTNRGKFARPK